MDSLWALSLARLSGCGIGIKGFSDASGLVSKLCLTERAQVRYLEPARPQLDSVGQCCRDGGPCPVLDSIGEMHLYFTQCHSASQTRDPSPR